MLSSTALSNAARDHDLTALRAALLVEASAPVYHHAKGKTALMLASQHCGAEALPVVLALLATGTKGCALNSRDRKGRTALMLAARCGSEVVLQALIEAGAELEVLCDKDESAWSKAKRAGQQEMCGLLEAAGARNEKVLGNSGPQIELLSMPCVTGCDATRFSSQYRGRMAVCLRALVASWPACTAWANDRQRLIERMDGTRRRVAILPAEGPAGRSVAADVRMPPQDGATLSVDECLSRALDGVRLDSVTVASTMRSGPEPPGDSPFVCKLPLTTAMLPDLGSIPGQLFGTPAAALAGETRFWLSSSGCQTPLHFDHCHSVICQVVGRKRITCFAPCDSHHLYPFSQADGNVRASRVDLWSWRFGGVKGTGEEEQRLEYQKVAAAVPLECVLTPGDVAYIPPGWWHMTETLAEGSISVLLPFDMSRAEQQSLDRPWTRSGWGEHSPRPASELEGLAERAGGSDQGGDTAIVRAASSGGPDEGVDDGSHAEALVLLEPAVTKTLPAGLGMAQEAAFVAFVRSESSAGTGVRICNANNLSVYWSGADPFQAERCPPVCFRRLLGASEIEVCHAAAAASGRRERDEGTDVCAALATQFYDVVYSSRHVASYLHRHGHFASSAATAALHDKLVSVMTSRYPGVEPVNVPLHVRCVELHAYAPGGALLEAAHRDNGSKWTLVVQLSASADFDGGHFVTWHEGEAVLHQLQRGDGLLINSERMHNVAPVTRGLRHSLVIELWVAPANQRDRFG